MWILDLKKKKKKKRKKKKKELSILWLNIKYILLDYWGNNKKISMEMGGGLNYVLVMLPFIKHSKFKQMICLSSEKLLEISKKTCTFCNKNKK